MSGRGLTEAAAFARIGIQREDGPSTTRESAEERIGTLEERAGLQPHRVRQRLAGPAGICRFQDGGPAQGSQGSQEPVGEATRIP